VGFYLLMAWWSKALNAAATITSNHLRYVRFAADIAQRHPFTGDPA
jgi:hypothetical protein